MPSQEEIHFHYQDQIQINFMSGMKCFPQIMAGILIWFNLMTKIPFMDGKRINCFHWLCIPFATIYGLLIKSGRSYGIVWRKANKKGWTKIASFSSGIHRDPPIHRIHTYAHNERQICLKGLWDNCQQRGQKVIWQKAFIPDGKATLT